MRVGISQASKPLVKAASMAFSFRAKAHRLADRRSRFTGDRVRPSGSHRSEPWSRPRSDPRTRRISLWCIVSRFVAMSAKSLASPHPGSAASSIKCCVASFTRVVLPEIWGDDRLRHPGVVSVILNDQSGRTLGTPRRERIVDQHDVAALDRHRRGSRMLYSSICGSSQPSSPKTFIARG